MRIRCLWIFAAALFLNCGLLAQTPSPDIRATFASLQQFSSNDLNTLRTSTSPVLKGFAALESHARTHDLADAAAAARYFSQSIRVDGHDPWAHFGLGLTLYHAKKTMAIVRQLGVADGEAIFVAKRELEKALELAPDFGEAASVLAAVALQIRDDRALARARGVLTRSSDSAQMIISEVDLALGDTAAVLARTPRTAVDYLRRARVLFTRHNDRAGGESYLRGLELWDSASAAEYVREALLVGAPNEAAELASGSLSQRVAALKLFWTKRAVRNGVTVAQRIGEHYRRLAIARERYRIGRVAGATVQPPVALPKEIIAAANEFDDRGPVYLRYGEPSQVLRATGPELKSNESWIYRAAGGYAVYRFATDPMGSGFHLIADAFNAFETPIDGPKPPSDEFYKALAEDFISIDFFSDQGKYEPAWAGVASRLLMLRTAMHALYTSEEERRQAIEDAVASLRLQAIESTTKSQQHLIMALTSDEAPRRYRSALPAYRDVATFRGSGCTDVIYSLTAPGPSYGLTVTVADTLIWKAQMVDTTVVMESAANRYLRSSGVFCVPPRPAAYIRFDAFVDSTAGTAFRGDIEVPDYSGKTLMMSDLLFATVEPGKLVRGNAQLAPMPHLQFRQSEAFRLFYELYNMPLGHTYRTEISFTNIASNRVSKLFSGKKTMTVTFDAESPSEDAVQELRTIMPQIEAGEVDVHVRVTDLQTNEEVSKGKRIRILPAKS